MARITELCEHNISHFKQTIIDTIFSDVGRILNNNYIQEINRLCWDNKEQTLGHNIQYIVVFYIFDAVITCGNCSLLNCTDTRLL